MSHSTFTRRHRNGGRKRSSLVEKFCICRVVRSHIHEAWTPWCLGLKISSNMAVLKISPGPAQSQQYWVGGCRAHLPLVLYISWHCSGFEDWHRDEEWGMVGVECRKSERESGAIRIDLWQRASIHDVVCIEWGGRRRTLKCMKLQGTANELVPKRRRCKNHQFCGRL